MSGLCSWKSFLLCSLSKSHCTQENQTQRFSFQGSLMTLKKCMLQYGSVNCDSSFTFLQLLFIKTSSTFSSVIVPILFVVCFALPLIKTQNVLQQLNFLLPLKVNFLGGGIQVNNLKNDLFLFLLHSYKLLMDEKKKGWSNKTIFLCPLYIVKQISYQFKIILFFNPCGQRRESVVCFLGNLSWV